MVRKARSDKKGTTCPCCGHKCSTPQKLREHLKRKNPCKSLQEWKNVAFTKVPIQASIQEFKQHPIRESVQTSKPELQTTAHIGRIKKNRILRFLMRHCRFLPILI